MTEIVFTVDYEIFGNGEGSLKTLVFEPAERLRTIFDQWKARFVVFADVAELEMIDANHADSAIGLIKGQLRDLRRDGFEIGLHIHPWWYNARREGGRWILDQTEYNLCTLPLERMRQIVDRALAFLCQVLREPDFSPVSFRAGHLLFQPTQPLADVLAERGIRLDSSVFKGGLWRQHMLDYRRAPKDAHFWTFRQDVSAPDDEGALLEVPVYTRQAPVWKLLTSKRVGLQQPRKAAKQAAKRMVGRALDFLRFRYPLKLDLGQMTREEMLDMVNGIIRDGRHDPSTYRPIVAMMHTKDPIDFDAVGTVLAALDENRIKTATLAEVYDRIKGLGDQPHGRAWDASCAG